jgi:DNA ligase 1
MTPFAKVAQLAEETAATASRLKKRAAIAQAIAAIHAGSPTTDDAGLFAMYLAGTPFAESDPRKLNAGGALLTKAALAVTGATDAALTVAYRRHGDLGSAAFDLLQAEAEPQVRRGTNPLTLGEVAEALAAIAVAGSTAARAGLVEGLLRRATPLEAKYLIKLMLGDMRIGVKQSLVEEAIAAAASTPDSLISPSHVRHAVMLEADLGSAVRRAFAGTLSEARMRLFHPLGFMLASPVETPEEAVERFTKGNESAEDDQSENQQDVVSARIAAFLEDKYDGMRAQIHCGDPDQPGRVAIYSRNRDDITESFPELAEAFANVRADIDGPLILDGEILGWDFGPSASNNNTRVPHSSHRDEWDSTEVDLPAARALPFAVLGQRIGRKRVSNDIRTRIPVIFMVFDVLYAGGGLTLHLPLRERRIQLERIVESLTDRATSPLEVDERATAAQGSLFAAEAAPAVAVPRLMMSPARLVESAEDIDRAYAAARARSNEGVMIKAADSHYQPGRRGLAWVKLKRELATLDVVITGAEYGHGKRAGLLSDYTFAVRGPDFERTGELLNVGKAYSGITDAEIAELTEFLKAHTLEDQGHFRTVEPLIVLDVAFNNIMRSTRHSSGFALRFPRILRLRLDKPIAEIDTLNRVEEIYQSQVDKPVE